LISVVTDVPLAASLAVALSSPSTMLRATYYAIVHTPAALLRCLLRIRFHSLITLEISRRFDGSNVRK